MEEINSKGAGGGDAADAAGATRALASTISALPELQEKKRLLDAHMNIATELLRQIQSRSLDSYYALEENLMDGRPLGKDDRATLAQLMTDGGNADDRARLLMLLALYDTAVRRRVARPNGIAWPQRATPAALTAHAAGARRRAREV